MVVVAVGRSKLRVCGIIETMLNMAIQKGDELKAIITRGHLVMFSSTTINIKVPARGQEGASVTSL